MHTHTCTHLQRVSQHVDLLVLVLHASCNGQQLLRLGLCGVVVAEQGGCGLAEAGTERVGEPAVPRVPIQEGGDEG